MQICLPASDQPNVIEASQRLEEILMKREQAIDTDAMATSNTDSGTGEVSPCLVLDILANRGVLSDTMTGSNSAASLTETTFQLRKYQMDLAEAAIRGENAVICAPTGSGKTYVAAEIIKRHFAIGNGRGKKPKVAFLVPTTQLVDQQFDVVKAYLGQTQKDVRIKRMKGGSTSSTTEPKAEGAALNDVIVTTPQVLLNIFKDATTTTPISLFSFTLVVLDECHHTDNEHPYNEVMNQYLDVSMLLWLGIGTGRLIVNCFRSDMENRPTCQTFRRSFASRLRWELEKPMTTQKRFNTWCTC